MFPAAATVTGLTRAVQCGGIHDARQVAGTIDMTSAWVLFRRFGKDQLEERTNGFSTRH